METEAFWGSGAVQRVLARAARITETGIAVHATGEASESRLLDQCGGCASACSFVAKLPWGAQACLKSREPAAEAALKRDKPVPFVCHMGFSCAAVAPRLPLDEAAVLTLGPFCPSEAPDSLLVEAAEGLARLEQNGRDELPFELDDIPLLTANAVPEIAEWIAETLLTTFATLHAPPPRIDQPAARETEARPRSRAGTDIAEYRVGDVLAALTTGDRAQARSLVQRDLDALVSPVRSAIRGRQAATVAVVAAVVQRAEIAGMDCASARERFPELHAALEEMSDTAEMSKAAMRVLRQVKAIENEAQASCAAIGTIIDQHLVEGITLEAAAGRLGEPPSTITRRLQRTIGMSFSEFVARRRVDRAKELLRTTQLRVAEVARRVGLNDASNLGKLFRKFERQSPSEYRRHHAPSGRTGTR